MNLVAQSVFPNDCALKKVEDFTEIQQIICYSKDSCFCIGLTTGESFEANLKVEESVYHSSNPLSMVYIIGICVPEYLIVVSLFFLGCLNGKQRDQDKKTGTSKKEAYKCTRAYCFITHYPFWKFFKKSLKFIVSSS